MSHGSSGLLCEDAPVPPILHRKKGNRGPWSSLLSEEFFDFLHPRLGAGVVSIAVRLADRLELAQQLPLSVGQVYRSFDDDVAEQVAVFPAAHTANALATQPKYLPRLSLGGDSDLRRTVQSGYFDLPAERRRRETDRHLAVKVVVVALKNRMGLDLDLHVKIACRPAIDSGLAFARKTDAIAIVYAGGNLDRERFLFFHSRGAVAARAGLGDDLSGSVAFRARLLDGEKPLLHAHLAVPFTGRAGSRLGPGFRPRPLPSLAILVGRDANAGFSAVRCLLQRDLEVVTQVGSAVHRGAARARLVEDIAENIAERVGEARKARPSAGHARARIDTCVAVAVIGGPLAGVGQDLVGLFGLLEQLFGLRVVRIAIRMMLHREAPIRFLDDLLVGVAVDAQHFVVIPLRHCSALPLPDTQRPS